MYACVKYGLILQQSEISGTPPLTINFLPWLVFEKLRHLGATFYS